MLVCQFCNRICKSKSSYSNHSIRCPSNPDRKIEPKTLAGRKRISDAAKLQNASMWTDEFREKHSRSMHIAVRKNPDSYTKNNVCGRVKNIKYKGYILKGSWEVKTAKWLDTLGEKWQHEVNPQEYVYNGRNHLYYPDFFLPKRNVYIEVKGYKTKRDNAKWSQFNGILLIIDDLNINNLDNLVFEDLTAR